MMAGRLQASSEQPFGTTIISVIEQFRGWSAQINRAKDLSQEISAYDRFGHFLELLRQVPVFPFDAAAADEFARLRSLKLRIGSMDLRIAAIALVNDALLLSANLRDFRRVPGLRVEDWLRP